MLDFDLFCFEFLTQVKQLNHGDKKPSMCDVLMHYDQLQRNLSSKFI